MNSSHFLRLAGRAQDKSRLPRPTAAALSPSSPAPRRKWAARRPRPSPAARPRPPERCSGSLPPLPGLAGPDFGDKPSAERARGRQAKTLRYTSYSPPLAPELLYPTPLAGAQAGSAPPQPRRKEERRLLEQPASGGGQFQVIAPKETTKQEQTKDTT